MSMETFSEDMVGRSTKSKWEKHSASPEHHDAEHATSGQRTKKRYDSGKDTDALMKKVVSDTQPSEHEPEKLKKKRKKTQNGLKEADSDRNAVVEEKGERDAGNEEVLVIAEKKNKRKRRKELDSATEEGREKKRRRDKAETKTSKGITLRGHEEKGARKSMKKQKVLEAEHAQDTVKSTATDDDEDGGKRWKKRRQEEEIEVGGAGIEVTEGRETKKKKSKKKTEGVQQDLADPRDDESLSDQARKALVYAFAQFSEPDKWKFHKARQNWLIRNLWSEETIPEKYLPLLLRYLAGVQGGTRENLITVCESNQTPSKLGDEKATNDGVDETTEKNEKQARAHAVLAALQI